MDSPGKVESEGTARDERIRRVGQGSSHGMYLSASYLFVRDLDLGLGVCFVSDRRSSTRLALPPLVSRLRLVSLKVLPPAVLLARYMYESILPP